MVFRFAFRRMRTWRLGRLLAGLLVMVLLVTVLFIALMETSNVSASLSGRQVEDEHPHLKQARPAAHRRVAARPPPDADPVNFLEEDCETCDDKLPVLPDAEARTHGHPVRHLGQEKIQLFRHYYGFEPWPQLELNASLPGQVPPTLHYLWCKGEELSLGFHHYLGILSALRLLQPVKVIFHFNRLPRLDHDMYYTWFLELKQSLPSLVLQALPRGSPPCGSAQLLDLALSLLQQDGGVFLGSNVILSRVPRNITLRPFWFAFAPNAPFQNGSGRRELFDVTRGVIIAREGFSDVQKHDYLRRIMASPPACVSPEVFDAHAPDSPLNARCVVVRDQPDIYPKAIMYAKTSFGQLARWLYYGTRSLMFPKSKQGQPIPRISHLIWFSEDRGSPYEMEFYQFLTVLSALYVGGFHHVYVHGNAGFRGSWWHQLAQENVTFIRMEDPEMIYQQRVNNPSHKSDVTRYAILHQYGGAYHDFEAMWTMRVPDWLLDYPCVATSDWAAYGEFPDSINPGVLLAKRHAPWLRYNLASHRYYVEENFVWNAVLMSYRTYERHPDQLLFYRHLQVMCDFGICHPSWEMGFRRNIDDRRPTMPFNWRTDTLAVHVTRPDPATSFVSPDSLKKGGDMFAEIGRHILHKSGRLHLLD